MKICKHCKKSKKITEYGKNKQNKGGYEVMCKPCKAKVSMKYRDQKQLDNMKKWREDNKEEVQRKKQEYYLENKEHIKAKSAKHRKDKPDMVKATRVKYCDKNRKSINEKRKEYYQQNTEKAKAAISAWRIENRGYMNAYGAKRHAAKLLRTPKWLTQVDKMVMGDIYIKAQAIATETGVLHDVDHIIPLQGKLVSGLHVPTNLQILTASKNRSKYNEFEP